MLIPEEHVAYELRNCLDDIYGCWPNMARLPRMSSLWKEDEDYKTKNQHFGYHRYYAEFGDSKLCVYTGNDEILIEIENSNRDEDKKGALTE